MSGNHHWFPASIDTVALYIAHLFEAGYASSTITTHISTVGYYHKLYASNDPTAAFIIRKMLVGVGKARPTSDVRLPITPGILHNLVGSTHLITQSHYHSVMLKAMYLLAFHAFLRISELAVAKTDKHVLKFNNISLTKSHLTISFDSFKHHKGDPCSIAIPRTASQFCPAAHIESYLSLRGSRQGPLFLFPDHQPVPQSYVRSQLRASLHLARLQTATLTSHSFRIGAATEAVRRGFSDDEIRRMGRWSSSAFKNYIRLPCLNLQ